MFSRLRIITTLPTPTTRTLLVSSCYYYYGIQNISHNNKKFCLWSSAIKYSTISANDNNNSNNKFPTIFLTESDKLPILSNAKPDHNNENSLVKLPKWILNTEPITITEKEIHQVSSALSVPIDQLHHKITQLTKTQLRRWNHTNTAMTDEIRFLLSFGCKLQIPSVLFFTGLYLLDDLQHPIDHGNTSPKEDNSEILDHSINKISPEAARQVVDAIRKLQKQNKRKKQSKTHDELPILLPTQDKDWGIELMKQSGNLGYVPALLYLSTISTNKNEQIELLKKAVSFSTNQNNKELQGEVYYALGSVLFDDSNTIKEAIHMFENAAHLDNVDALYFLGHLYHVGVDGDGDDKTFALLEKDEMKAKELLTKAAHLGTNGEAELYLAKWEMESPTITTANSMDNNNKSIIRYLVDACKKNNGEAMYLLADAHVNGELGLPQDNINRAIELYELAGKNGYVDGFLSAGALCMMRGNQQQQLQTYSMYIQAAHGGSGEAWKRIAALYMKGEGGVEQDIDFAQKILKEIT
jgi:TPR repeat protein